MSIKQLEIWIAYFPLELTKNVKDNIEIILDL
jgi:hypothetical protein